eukprot:862-Heterococcus_DN1.PRE.1
MHLRFEVSALAKAVHCDHAATVQALFKLVTLSLLRFSLQKDILEKEDICSSDREIRYRCIAQRLAHCWQPVNARSVKERASVEGAAVTGCKAPAHEQDDE